MRPEYLLRGTTRRGDESGAPKISTRLINGLGTVTIDGRTHDVAAVSVGSRYVSLMMDDRLLQVPFVGDRDRLLVWVRGAALEFVAVDDTDDESDAHPGGFSAEVRAPMPGKILSIEVTTGQELTVDDAVVLMGCQKCDDYQCHYADGSQLAETRLANMREAVERMQIEPERLKLTQLAINEYDKLPVLIDEFVGEISEMGMNPMREFV